MLPPFYKFTIGNFCGQNVAANGVTVKARRWKHATDGSLEFESSEAAILDNVSFLANNDYIDGTAQDNTSTKWEGGTFEFTAIGPSGASGPIVCYLKRSTDGTDFDDNASSIEVDRFLFSTAGTKRLTFQL